MKIKKVIYQKRRDFRAVYQCEHCEKEHEDYGYDDDNFHKNVIPSMKCKSCGKTSPKEYRPLSTKYAAYEVV